MENTPNVNHVVTENDLLLAPHVFPEGTVAGDVVTMTNDGLAEIGYTLHLVKETDLDLHEQGYEIGQYVELPLPGNIAETAVAPTVQSGADVVANPNQTEEQSTTANVDIGEAPQVLSTPEVPTSYRGCLIVGTVEDINHNGTPMKKFTTDDKSNFMVSVEDYNANITTA